MLYVYLFGRILPIVEGWTKRLESDSIANQRKLILEYISKHPNIQLVKEAKDDGYTGTNSTVRDFRKYWIRSTAVKQTA